MWRYNSIYHSGVLGMKWGHRKQTSSNQKIPKKVKKSSYDKWDVAGDKYNYGKKGQKRIETKVLAGKSKTLARGEEFVKSQIKGWGIVAVGLDISSGGQLHKAAGRSIGKAFVNSYLKSKAAKTAAKSVIRIAQNKKYNPIDVAYKILN